MGAERAQIVVGLQGTLMRAVGDFGDDACVRPLKDRLLATAAALDYVLMLATGSAGTRILERDTERAIHDGLVRAVDDLIAGATAIGKIGTPPARAFAREAAKALNEAVRAEDLATNDRLFALIAMANP